MPIVDGRTPEAVAQAADRLAAGELVGLPTETVYGLGARADDGAAVQRIFAAKGRPAEHPLIVHVQDVAAAQQFAADWPAWAQQLAAAFWPGPVTVIVPRRSGVAEAAAGGQDSIGLRCPSHPVARELLAAAAARGVPGVAAPSANRFGRVSPTRAAHVASEFGDELLVLDGGECDAGIESAIVDCTGPAPRLLRPGSVQRAALEAVLGRPLAERDETAPRASGTLESHYAPRARVRLMEASQIQTALGVLGSDMKRNTLAVYCRTFRPRVPGIVVRAMPDRADGAAHDLYAALRELDDTGVALIWVEIPPEDPVWDGVRDRLRRAAA